MGKLMDKCIFFLMFLQIAVLNYWNLSNTGIKLICGLILIRFIMFRYINKFLLKNALFILGIVIVCALSAKLGHSNHLDVFVSNILSVLYALLTVVYLAYMLNTRYSFVENIMNKFGVVLNGYFLLNIIVLLIQANFSGFMTGVSTWVNPMSEDLICGTFGYSCTPQLGLYSCFIILYNFYWIRFYLKEEKSKKAMLIYNYCLIIFALAISMVNDNKAVFLELGIFMLFYLYVNGTLGHKGKITRKGNKYVFMILAAGGSFLLLYYISPTIRSFFYDKIFYSFEKIFSELRSSEFAGYGSAERVYQVIYAFIRYNALGFGYGTGSFIWHAGKALGFNYFGQGDLGAFLCLGGMWFTLLVLVFMVYNGMAVVFGTNENKSYVYCCIVGAIMLFLMLYTQIVTTNTINLIFLFVLVIFGMTYRQSSGRAERN